MLEKPKRPKKISNQDNKQPQSIQELIRRYDLDNTKIYDFLDELVTQINSKINQNKEELSGIKTNVKGTVLYEDATGTTGNVTLNETSANFSYLEIYYKARNSHSSIKIHDPNGKNAVLYADGEVSNSDYICMTKECARIDGVTITRSGFASMIVSSSGVNLSTDNSYYTMTIYKVIGYR